MYLKIFRNFLIQNYFYKTMPKNANITKKKTKKTKENRTIFDLTTDYLIENIKLFT